MNESKDLEAPLAESPPVAEPDAGDAATVWLVSFSDNDDRELTAPQIAEALRAGAISAETIVWREGAADWLPIPQVPELAKLLPSSGETAAAPLVASSPVVSESGARDPEAKATAALTEAKPPTASIGAKPRTASVGAKPTIGGRAVPVAKGTTKLGLPRVEPKAVRKSEATPLPKVANPAAGTPAQTTPVAAVATGATVPADQPSTPRAATASAVASPAKTTPGTPSTPNSSRARTSGTDIWGSSNTDEEAPVSIEPEFLRPPSPAPARAIQRAKALSAGTLGMPRKKPPAPPRPPEKLVAPEPALSSDPGTPSLGALAAPAVVQSAKADDGIASLGAETAETPLMGPPTIDVSNVAAESGQRGVVAEEASTTPTESSASIASQKGQADKGSEGPVAAARAAEPAKPSRKNVAPMAAAAAAVVLLAWLFMHGKRNADVPQADLEPQAPPARSADPETPTQHTNPEVTEPPGTPAMTARAAPEEAPAESAAGAAPAAEKPGAPSTTPVANREATEPAKGKAAESKPAETKVAETKPLEAKPAAAPAPAQKEVAVGGDFDKAAAGTALSSAAQEASSCRKEGDPSGVAVVHLTFSNAGHATRAVIEGPPFAGTATGGCIASILRKATVPPYGGDRVTVTKKVIIH